MVVARVRGLPLFAMWAVSLYWLSAVNATCEVPPLGARPARIGGPDNELRATSAFGSFQRGPPVNVSWDDVPCVVSESEQVGLTTCVIALGAPIRVAIDRPPVVFDTTPTRSSVIAANATAAVSTADGISKLALLLPNARPSPVCPEGAGWRFKCECIDSGIAICAGAAAAPPVARCHRAIYSMDADPFGATAAVVLVATVAYCFKEATPAAALGLAAMLPVSAIVTQLPAVTAGKAGAAAAAGVMLGAHSGGLAAFGPTNARVGMAVAVVAGGAAAAFTHSAGLYALVAFVAGAGAAVAMASTLGAADATEQSVASTVLGMAVAPLVACAITAAQAAAPALTAPIALAVATAIAGGCAGLGAAQADEAAPAVTEMLVAEGGQPVEEAPAPESKYQPPLRALAAVAAAAAMAPAYWPGVFRTTFAYAAVVIASTVADVAGRAVPGGEAVAAAVLGGVMVVATAANVAGESSDLSEVSYAAVVFSAAFLRGRVVSAVAIKSNPAGRVAVVRAMVLGGVVGALGGVPALVVWG